MKKFTSHTVEDTGKIAAKWLADLVPTPDGATVVGLHGELGAGKTAFVQAVGKALGVKDFVTSPTFVIMKIYETEDERWRRLVHIDAYRLEGGSQLEALSFEQFVADPHNLILIEWADNVKEALPSSTSSVSFSHLGEKERTIIY